MLDASVAQRDGSPRSRTRQHDAEPTAGQTLLLRLYALNRYLGKYPGSECRRALFGLDAPERLRYGRLGHATERPMTYIAGFRRREHVFLIADSALTGIGKVAQPA